MTSDKLILGTVQFGLPYGVNNLEGLPSYKSVQSILSFARNHITTLDTAHGYGISEERIGKYHGQEQGDKFEVNTKFSKGQIYNPLREVEKAVVKLNVPVINTMMFHSLDDYYLNHQGMAILLNEGKDRYFKKFGVSVYTVEELEELNNISEIDVVQVSFNLLDNHSKKGSVLQKLKNKGKEIHVRSCFLQGLFFKSTHSLTGKLRDAIKYIDRINTIARDAEISIGELALSYCISKKYIDKVLIGVDNNEQLIQNLKWASKGLNEDVENIIDSINVKEEDLLNPSKW